MTAVDPGLVRRLAVQGDQPEPLFIPAAALHDDEMPACTGCASPLCPDHRGPVADTSVRGRAVQAFNGAAAAALATGDRPLEEQLHRLAVDLGHHDTTDATLAGLMQAFAATTEETTR